MGPCDESWCWGEAEEEEEGRETFDVTPYMQMKWAEEAGRLKEVIQNEMNSKDRYCPKISSWPQKRKNGGMMFLMEQILHQSSDPNAVCRPLYQVQDLLSGRSGRWTLRLQGRKAKVEMTR